MDFTRSALMLVALLVAGCQLSPQPAGPVYYPAVVEQPSVVREAVRGTEAQAPPAATVVPIKAQRAINELRQQGQLQLKQSKWNEAIVIAERGLRVDRREAGFYWLLAQAYQGLGEVSSAAAFARQGLRYTPRNSGLYSDLQALLLAL